MIKNKNPKEAKLSEAFREGFKHENFFQTIKREYKELQNFYLDDDRRSRLTEMGIFRRIFWTLAWLLKLLFLKLHPIRRLVLLVGLILSIISPLGNGEGSGTFGIDSNIVGPLIVLFVLMLELKDKLLARDELEAGRRVQMALMPDRMPLVSGWEIWLYTRPANDVGGDLVDFYWIDEKTCGLALGDVSGKGLEAALFMAKLQATIRAYLTDFTTLSKLAEKINRTFHRDSLPNKFASIVFAEFQPNESRVTLLNAGHMPPIVLRGDQIEEIETHAPAFGLMAEADFEANEIELNSNDILLLYSDGVTEARNDEGVFFGEKRLNDVLKFKTAPSAQEVGETIIRAIADFKNDAPFYDDISLVVLKRAG
ncbi:MAG: serine/threonine-protein phosphatase [Calditrichaeota bacterium]|nr:MAG: serine/threonine-protein phosphatase [Calditrichota bacterium]